METSTHTFAVAKERERPVRGAGKLEKPVESGLEGFRNSMLFSWGFIS